MLDIIINVPILFRQKDAEILINQQKISCLNQRFVDDNKEYYIKACHLYY
jgi:hypothetical protein